MKNVVLRLAMVIAVVLVTHGLFLAVRLHGMPTEFRSLQRDLTTLRMDLGDWKGKPEEVDPRIAEALAEDAEVVVDRTYRDAYGRTVTLHANVVSHYEPRMRHDPKHCYTSHGFELIDERRVELKSNDEKDPWGITARMLTMEAEGNRALVLYWYQFGDHIVSSPEELRTARYEFRGQKTWPSVVKVLLQTAATDAEQSQKRLMDFARVVYAETKDLDRAPAAAPPANP